MTQVTRIKVTLPEPVVVFLSVFEFFTMMFNQQQPKEPLEAEGYRISDTVDEDIWGKKG